MPCYYDEKVVCVTGWRSKKAYGELERRLNDLMAEGWVVSLSHGRNGSIENYGWFKSKFIVILNRNVERMK